MDQRPLLLHLINSLTVGGAEILLQNSVNLLPEYRHLVAYLDEPDTLRPEFRGEVRFICLSHKGWKNSYDTVRKIRQIIRAEKPVLVHSHLFASCLLARIATPRNLPLFNTIHSTLSLDAFEVNSLSLWAERLTLRPRHSVIAVSQYVMDDYLRHVAFRGKKHVLYNFLPSQSFLPRSTTASQPAQLRCVAVGNLKSAKNYGYLLQIFSSLKHRNIMLDIYGEGGLRSEMEEQIQKEGLTVRLMGNTENITDVLSGYDLFIQVSKHEGFGLSVIEAMAAKVPTLLSDIPVFREITGDLAHFIPLNNPYEATRVLEELSDDPVRRRVFIGPAYKHCLQYYTEEIYKKRLLNIYQIKQALASDVSI